MTLKSPRGVALILSVLGLACRLVLAAVLGLNNPPRPGSDQAEYDTYAWNLAQGRGYRGMSPDVADQDHLTAYRVPGTSLAWAGLYGVFGHRYDLVRILNCLAGAAAVLVVFEIGTRCYDSRIGVGAAAVTAIFPTMLIYTVDLLSEALGTLWFLTSILACLWFAERPGWGRSAAAGFLLGLAILTRPNSVFMVPLLAVWAAWQYRRQWRLVLQAVTIPVVALATLVPWTARNYLVFHEFIPLATSGGSGLLQGNNDVVVSDPKYFGYCYWDSKIPEYQETLESAGTEAERDRRAKNLAIQWLKDHPEKWPFLIWSKFCRSLTPFLQPTTPTLYRIAMLASWGPVVILFGMAYFPTLITFLRQGHPGWLIHLAILHYVLTSVVFYALSRYRMPVEPFCIILAVKAVDYIARRLSMNRQECDSGHAAEFTTQ